MATGLSECNERGKRLERSGTRNVATLSDGIAVSEHGNDRTKGNALSLNLDQNAAKHTPKHKCTTNNNFEHKRVLHNLRFMGFIINGQSANKRHCKKIFGATI